MICVGWVTFAILGILAAFGLLFIGFVLHTWFFLGR